MATTTSLTTSYAGQDSKLWVKAALLSGNTLSKGGLTIVPNIAYKTRVAPREIARSVLIELPNESNLK